MPEDQTNSFDNLIEFVKKNWFGEFYYFIIILIVVDFFCLWLVTKLQIIDDKIFLILAILDLILSIPWVISRYCYPMGHKDKIDIILSLHEENDSMKKDVEEKFIEIMDIYDFLSKKIAIKVLNKYKSSKVNKRTVAEKFAKSKNWNLLIWGKAKKYDDQYVFDVKFTNTYGEGPNKKNTLFIKEKAKEILDNKSWRISSERKFSEIKKIAENLREVSLYIIGCSCMTMFDYEAALNSFYILYGLIKEDKIKIKSDPNTKRVFKNIPDLISDCYHSMAINSYFKQKDTSNSLMLMDIAIAWKVNDRLLLNKAYLYYLNDFSDIEGLLKSIEENNDKRFFFAFISMMKDEKIEFAYNLYQKCFTKKYSFFNISSEIFYIKDYWEKHKEKIQCLFVLGMILYNYNDKKNSKKYFKNFLKNSKNQKNLNFLIEKASYYLKNL